MGVVGAFDWAGTVFGTIRVLPMGQGVAPCDGLVERAGSVPAELLENAWEVGRLVLDPAHRGGPDLLRRCLCLTLAHVMDHTDARHFFASCRPALARLYRRFGMEVIVRDLGGCPGDEPYCLIHGDVDSIERAIGDDLPARRPVVLQ